MQASTVLYFKKNIKIDKYLNQQTIKQYFSTEKYWKANYDYFSDNFVITISTAFLLMQMVCCS